MLEKVIKKEYTKILFSFYGILSLFSMILPLVMLGFGIYFLVKQTYNYGIIWTAVGALFLLFSIRKLKDFMPTFKYIFNPKSFPQYKNLVESEGDLSIYEKEIEEANLVKGLTKANPLIVTEHFVFGYSQVSFFFFKKEDLMWIYEYNGNGLVFYDKNKVYGFTFFNTVDGNDIAIEKLEDEMPYLYYGIDFDYKTIMHDDFDNTVILVQNERDRYLLDPEGYKAEKEALKKAKEEAETKALEEERARQMESIMEGHDDVEETQEAIETETQEEETKEEEPKEEK